MKITELQGDHHPLGLYMKQMIVADFDLYYTSSLSWLYYEASFDIFTQRKDWEPSPDQHTNRKRIEVFIRISFMQVSVTGLYQLSIPQLN